MQKKKNEMLIKKSYTTLRAFGRMCTFVDISERLVKPQSVNTATPLTLFKTLDKRSCMDICVVYTIYNVFLV